MGFVLIGLALLSICDLTAVLLVQSPSISDWRPAVVPALAVVLFIAPFLFYKLVWVKLAALRRASNAVLHTASRSMILRVWKKDVNRGRSIYFFELEPEQPFGCVTASFVIIVNSVSQSALSTYCEESWTSKIDKVGVLKAFVDEATGLPVAVQTIDALQWVDIDLYPVSPDDKERLLTKADSKYQLSTDGK